jgi:hypothetical protein
LKHYALLLSIVLALGNAAPVATSATPGVYPLLCSGGELAPGKTATGAHAFQILTAPLTNPGSALAAICGWRTRAWPSNQPKLLCLSAAVLAAIENRSLGEIGTRGPPIDSLGTLYLDGMIEFATAGYANGCLNVTSARPYDAEGVQTTLVCHDAVMANMYAEPMYFGNQHPFAIEPGRAPANALAAGSCYALGTDPDALPPSHLLCIDTTFLAGRSNHFENSYPGTYEIRVSPWWPCGIASRVKAPQRLLLHR